MPMCQVYEMPEVRGLSHLITFAALFPPQYTLVQNNLSQPEQGVTEIKNILLHSGGTITSAAMEYWPP